MHKPTQESSRPLPPGDYVLQALLDTADTYGQTGPTSSAWMSSPIPVHLPLTRESPVWRLNDHPAPHPWDARAIAALDSKEIEEFRIVSPRLTAFFGEETAITGSVVLPPGYAPKSKTTYHTVYWPSGFSGSHLYDIFFGTLIRKRMDKATMPPMIWVMLDQNWHTGTQEFADSFNNGPWGAALTTETIPILERRYRMDGKPGGRFVHGHSRGAGHHYIFKSTTPGLFGGAWSTSPGQVDS